MKFFSKMYINISAEFYDTYILFIYLDVILIIVVLL